MGNGIKQLYEFGPFRVDPEKRLLLRQGEPVSLTPKAFETLLVLVQNSEKVVLKDDLMKALWPDTFVEESNLSQNVFMLRKALGETAQDHRYIVTVPGRGYRFAEKIRLIPGEPADLIVQTQTRSPVEIEEEGPSRWPILAGLLLLVGLAVIGYRWQRPTHPLGRESQPPPLPVAVPVPLRRSVAVLRFQNLSGDPRDAWLSTAISEMLATELTSGEQLRALSSEEVAQAKRNLALPDTDALSKSTLERLRKNLGSDLVVLGAYTELGKGKGRKIRLDVRLQDTAVGETVTSIAKTGNQSDLFDLVYSAGSELRQRLGVGELSHTQALGVTASLPAKPRAARAYAEGLAKLRSFDNLGARGLLEEAIAQEPKFALAHMALANALYGLGYDGKAQEQAKTAVELSSGLPREQHLWIEGHYRELTHDWPRAIETYRTLYNFFPDNLDYGLQLARAQTSASRAPEALAALDQLRRLPPPARDDPRIDETEAEAAASTGDFSRDEAASARAVEKGEPIGARLLVARARRVQCWALHRLGRQEEARLACDQAQRIFAEAGDRDGVASVVVTIAAILHERGNLAAARTRYVQALAIHRATGDQRRRCAMSNLPRSPETVATTVISYWHSAMLQVCLRAREISSMRARCMRNCWESAAKWAARIELHSSCKTWV